MKLVLNCTATTPHLPAIDIEVPEEIAITITLAGVMPAFLLLYSIDKNNIVTSISAIDTVSGNNP